MLFNSWQFAVFFPLVTILYFILPRKTRYVLLLCASTFFYTFFIPKYVLILFFLIVIDYIAGLVIEKARGRKRKLFLVISLVANIGTLALFKYFNFFNSNLRQLAEMFHLNYPLHDLSIILPIGLSFHTFQSMSYTIEVYRGHQKAERNFWIYALYVMFYPQLVAGPIERPQNLLHQFHKSHKWDFKRAFSGLQLMAIGLFKKMVIADSLARFANFVFNDPGKFSGFPLIMAVYFFTFQIYCDFSGYSDIARGAASVMGIELMVNFDKPYLATSIAEFWQRWHISLSTWFRDYLYIPLGGNRVEKSRHYANLLIVFLISGFWHGANWTFLAWGGLHGLYLITARITRGLQDRFFKVTGLARHPALRNALSMLLVFHLAAFAWIFFRAANVQQALHICSHLFAKTVWPTEAWATGGFNVTAELTMGVVLALGLLGVQLLDRSLDLLNWLSARSLWVRWSFYYVFIAVFLGITLFSGDKYSSQQFIYFQF